VNFRKKVDKRTVIFVKCVRVLKARTAMLRENSPLMSADGQGLQGTNQEMPAWEPQNIRKDAGIGGCTVTEEGQALWYVVHTYTGYEFRVAIEMRRVMNNVRYQNLVLDVMIPTRTVKEFSRGKVRVQEKRLFPGYVFVKMIKTTESWYIVRNVRGVTGFVGPGGQPTPISSAEFERIMLIQRPVKLDIKVGDKVTFKNQNEYDRLGFPIGMELIVEGITDDEHILQVSFLLANRKNVLDCDYDFCEVEKVKPLKTGRLGPAS